MSQEPFYRSRDGRTVLYGQEWTRAPRTGWAVLRCSLGRHRRVQWGTVSGMTEARCSCGAIRNPPSQRWKGGDPRMTRMPPGHDNLNGPF
jgi:hypothetical protein